MLEGSEILHFTETAFSHEMAWERSVANENCSCDDRETWSHDSVITRSCDHTIMWSRVHV